LIQKKKNIICCNNPAEKMVWFEDLSKIIDEFLTKAKKKLSLSHSSSPSGGRGSLDIVI